MQLDRSQSTTRWTLLGGALSLLLHVGAASFNRDFRHSIRSAISSLISSPARSRVSHANPPIRVHPLQQQRIELVREARAAIRAGHFEMGRFELATQALEHADPAIQREILVNGTRLYRQLLTEVQRLIQQEHLAVYDAIAQALDHYHYAIGSPSIHTYLTEHKGNCMAISATITSLLYDLGYHREAYFRYYTNHRAAIYRTREGEIDLHAGRWALRTGALVRAERVVELYAHDIGLPSSYQLRELHDPQDRFPDPRIVYAEHSVSRFDPNQPSVDNVPASSQVNSTNAEYTNPWIRDTLFNYYFSTPGSAPQGGSLIYFEISPISSTTAPPLPTDLPSATYTQLDAVSQAIAQQNGYLRGALSPAHRLIALARLVGLYGISEELLSSGVQTPAVRAMLTDVRRLKTQHATEARDVYASQNLRVLVGRLFMAGDQTPGGNSFLNLAYLGDIGVTILQALRNTEGSAAITGIESKMEIDRALLLWPASRATYLSYLSGLSPIQQLFAVGDLCYKGDPSFRQPGPFGLMLDAALIDDSPFSRLYRAYRSLQIPNAIAALSAPANYTLQNMQTRINHAVSAHNLPPQFREYLLGYTALLAYRSLLLRFPPQVNWQTYLSDYCLWADQQTLSLFTSRVANLVRPYAQPNWRQQARFNQQGEQEIESM